MVGRTLKSTARAPENYGDLPSHINQIYSDLFLRVDLRRRDLTVSGFSVSSIKLDSNLII
jgi:hypothetical protein